jgi:hypothetical protein
MVTVTCPIPRKDKGGKPCGYTWDYKKDKLWIRCTDCRKYFMNPKYDTEEKGGQE